MLPTPACLAALFAVATVGWLACEPPAAPPADAAALAVRQLHDPAAAAELDAARRAAQTSVRLLVPLGLAVAALTAAGVALTHTLTAREGQS